MAAPIPDVDISYSAFQDASRFFDRRRRRGRAALDCTGEDKTSWGGEQLRRLEPNSHAPPLNLKSRATLFLDLGEEAEEPCLIHTRKKTNSRNLWFFPSRSALLASSGKSNRFVGKPKSRRAALV
ncbi:hypothetical protein Droror1_Dr00021472 [Drosera rotundifolia]